jgi:hypothetical protein
MLCVAACGAQSAYLACVTAHRTHYLQAAAVWPLPAAAISPSLDAVLLACAPAQQPAASSSSKHSGHGHDSGGDGNGGGNGGGGNNSDEDGMMVLLMLAKGRHSTTQSILHTTKQEARPVHRPHPVHCRTSPPRQHRHSRQARPQIDCAPACMYTHAVSGTCDAHAATDVCGSRPTGVPCCSAAPAPPATQRTAPPAESTDCSLLQACPHTAALPAPH